MRVKEPATRMQSAWMDSTKRKAGGIGAEFAQVGARIPVPVDQDAPSALEPIRRLAPRPQLDVLLVRAHARV